MDNGAHTLRNVGDIAMLQVGVRRVRECIPGAELLVLTSQPELLPRYCPGTLPLTVAARDAGYDPEVPWVADGEERWQRAEGCGSGFPVDADEFQQALGSASAVILTGGGFLNDLNPTQTRSVLRMLAHAGALGKRVAAFGQGLGPLRSPELLSLLGEAARYGSFFGLREGSRGPGLVRSTGVRADRFCVTGDDAIELACPEHWSGRGEALGFSLRQIGYSGIEAKHRDILGETLSVLRARLQAHVLALPVSFNEHEADAAAMAQVMDEPFDATSLDTPQALMERVARCRLLVTGTYHAAVFALAQGTPCIGFYASDYYRDKMEGLARQFPGGMAVVDLNHPAAAEGMISAALALWDLPREDCERLRTAAADQVQAGQRFYRQALLA